MNSISRLRIRQSLLNEMVEQIQVLSRISDQYSTILLYPRESHHHDQQA